MNVSPLRNQPAPPPPPPCVPNFGTVDRADETLVLPGVDLFVRIAAGNAQDGTVETTLGDQALTYTWANGQCTGSAGELPLELKPGQCGCPGQLSGHLGDNALSESEERTPGALRVTGQAGQVAFDEQFYSDPWYGAGTIHVGDIYASLGETMYQASIYRTCDGYQLCGQLGDQAVDERLVLNPAGGGTIDGQIAGVSLHQVVTTAG